VLPQPTSRSHPWKITFKTMKTPPEENFGYQDTSFQAAGGYNGVKTLVDCFYNFMEQLPEAEAILEMHPDDLEISRDKLTHFLCCWLGGPRKYKEKYGPTPIPRVHQHLPIGEQERDAWMLCMKKAIESQPYTPAFKEYLIYQLSIPAERVRVASKANRQRLNESNS